MTEKDEIKEAVDRPEQMPALPRRPSIVPGAATNGAGLEDQQLLNCEATLQTTEIGCEARLAEIRSMFKGKAMSYIEMAERALEYHDIFKKRDIAQSAQKPRMGRPGVVSAMARELAVPGSSDAGKRAWIERALEVARMSPQAAEAAKKAKLDRNRSALSEIAKAGEPAKQLEKVEEIKRLKANSRKKAKTFVKRTVRFPLAGSKDILGKLIAFAEAHDIEVI